MREIKFRVWDVDEKEMVCWEHLITDPDYWLMEILDGKSDDILMQYTGLKDKNGKEIYEGDIVRVKYYGKPRVVKVEIDDCECEPFNSYNYSEDGWRQPDEAKVIGNIYENGDLLEKG